MLLEQIKNYRLILASGSPRRRDLMKAVGFDFEVSPGYIPDESYPGSLKGKEIPEYLARKKSEAYPYEIAIGEIVITADTVVCQDDEVLHKPASETEAAEILRKISGNSHFVYTGVCLRSALKMNTFVSSTEVLFGPLSESEINYYIQNYKPFDKAGAYGIQEWIGFVGVEEIRGSYFNVMGLPVHRLYRELEQMIQHNK